jgi:glycosyltransferase involved in cell wall biosynthesis
MTEARIRLLYVQPAPLFGGAERQAAEQASYLPEFGIDVTVMAGPGQAIIDWLRDSRASHVIHSANFPGGGPPKRGPSRLLVPLSFVTLGLRARAELEQIVRQQPIDVMLASLPFAWITGSLVARRAGIPIAWRAGGYYINPFQVAGMWSLTHFLRPDVLICNGKAVERTFHPLIPAPVEIVPNGVDLGVFGPSKGRPELYRPADASLVVGFAGRLASTKRPEDVIRLASSLRESHPDARVLIAGEGSRRRACERLAREVGADNVTFVGYVADMPSFYAACDIIVLPSRTEGSSNMLLEAMACGRPVVASDIPPLREQLQAEVTGLIYPLGNVPELTRAVRRLIAEPELRRTLAEHGREVASRSTARAAAERLSRVLKRLVADARAKRARGQTSSPAEPMTEEPSMQ